MDTPIIVGSIIGALCALIFFLSKTKRSEAEWEKPKIEKKQTASRLGTWIVPPQPNPDIRKGTVLYPALNEPVTIVSIFGKDRSDFQMDHFFFRWYDATNAQGAQFAVKLYHRGPTCEQIFQKELDASRLLPHPGIVKILGNGRFDGRTFSVFENMSGGTLRSWLQNHGKLKGVNVLSVLRQVAEALDFAHARGIIHSDVQPGNVWLDPSPEGRAALAEFGVTQAEWDVADLELPLPEGFPKYSAPEQFAATKIRCDVRAEIYSFGVMCYELIAGVDPWNQKGLIKHDASHIEKIDAPDIRTYRKDVPEPIAQRLIQTLNRDPALRPLSATAVLAGVEEEISKLGPV